MRLYTIKQVSEIIHKAEQSIYNDLSRNPASLPPRVYLPNTRRVLFKDVDLWLLSQIQPQQAIDYIEQPKPKRGRPTKAEQLTRTPRVGDASGTRRNNTH